ncbi:ABC transporter ATP-binding protein [Sphaerisporangium viridialbum]|uniref:ABC transporter ATP-binding protein n=1 Tax=Sphaerisporangium viridialbum TaxID=46189 RepID=UPI003C709539
MTGTLRRLVDLTGYARPVRRLVPDLTGYARPLRWIAWWSAVEALPALASGILVAQALDRGFLVGRPMAGGAWLALFGAAMLLKAAATRAVTPYVADLVERIRDAIMRSVVGATLDRVTAGVDRPDQAGVARLTQQVETVRTLLSVLLRSARQTVTGLLAALGGLATLAPGALLVILPPVVASMLLTVPLLRRVARRQRELMRAEERTAGHVGELFGATRDITACGAQSRADRDAAAVIDRQAALSRALARLDAVRPALAMLGGQLPLVFLLIGTPTLLRNGMTAGAVAGAVTYVSTTLEPALRAGLETVASWGTRLAAVLGRLSDLVTHAPVRPDAPADHRADGTAIELAGVGYAYAPGAEPVIDGLRLSVPEGGHLAIVGPSGAGKSTLADLLTGVCRPSTGHVLLGGVPVADLPRGVVVLVSQDAYVFAGTVRENLTCLAPAVDEARLWEAAGVTGLAAVVHRLGGLDAELGAGGSPLSAGEKQLVELTRAYLAPAPVVILDEATAHLDPVAEARVEAAFRARPGTLIVIAHRISSARRADRILVLGRPGPDLGTHDELLAGCDMYQSLVGHWTTSA